MEPLTGKAKDLFLKYFKKRNKIKLHELSKVGVVFNCQDELYQTALIIDFFDSVGIYLDCPPLIDYNPVKFGLLIDEKIHYSEQKNLVYNSRQEATIAGIKKANEIFNSKF